MGSARAVVLEAPRRLTARDLPLPESERIGGLVCFYNERVDLFVDGELQERPKTKFS